jgi:hypothetical protein
MQIILACIGMLAWKSQIKVQGFSLVHNLLGKMGRSHQTPLKLEFEFDWNVEVNLEAHIFLYLLAHPSQSH